MTNSNINQIICENKNTKTLVKEIYRINPSIKFSTIGDCITEKEALLLYNIALKNPTQNKNVIYVPILSM